MILVGFGAYGAKDAKKCSHTLCTWANVPETGPATEGDKLIPLYCLLAGHWKCKYFLSSWYKFQAVLAFEKSTEILQKDEEEIQRTDLLSLVLIHHAQVHVLWLSIGF